MSERKAVSKRTRFEVFKRDSFKCVYCGNHPPAVLLHIDHVIAVAEGGTNDEENLVTACDGCNLGKGAVPLTSIPTSLADKQAELVEREEQLAVYEAALRARRERVESEQWLVVEILEYEGTDSYPRDRLMSVRRFIEKLGFESVRDAAEIAKGYYRYGGRKAFLYFCGICWKRVRGEGG